MINHFNRFSLLFSAILISAATFFIVPTVALAQEGDGIDEAPEEVVIVPDLEANAGKDRNVVIGRTVLFDASNTVGIVDQEKTEFFWDFGDGTKAEGIDATHAYNETRTFRVNLRVVRTNEDGSTTESEDEILVAVQDRLVILIADQSVSENKITELQAYGEARGTLVIPIRDTGVNQDYLSVQQLAQKLLEQEEDLVASDMIVTWTTGGVGLNALIELSRVAALSGRSLEGFGFTSKAIVTVANSQALSATSRLAQTTFESIQPRYIVVSSENILDDAIAAGTADTLEPLLPGIDAEYQVVTPYTERGLQKLSPVNFMSYAMNYMINHGVPVNSLFLILMLPVMATIIASARQLVGIKAFGIFAPTVIALSFLATGIKFGVTVFFAVIILGTLARIIARRFKIMYLPRMATVLSLLALAIFAMFYVASAFGQTGFVAISIFPILIMTVVTEHFVSVQIASGYKTAFKLTLETLVLSIIGYYIADWTWFKSTILAFPELILLTLVVNYIIGKFSGLRISEYIRFRKVLKKSRDVQGSK